MFEITRKDWDDIIIFGGFGLLWATIVLTAAIMISQKATARDGWQDRPKVCGSDLTEGEYKVCRNWISNVEQPAFDTTASCCGESDAFLADAFEVDGEGNFVAVITEEYPSGAGDDGDGGSYQIRGYPKGSKIPIPKDKINPGGGKKGGNPTGHGIVFIDSMGKVLCYFSPTLAVNQAGIFNGT